MDQALAKAKAEDGVRVMDPASVRVMGVVRVGASKAGVRAGAKVKAVVRTGAKAKAKAKAGARVKVGGWPS